MSLGTPYKPATVISDSSGLSVERFSPVHDAAESYAFADQRIEVFPENWRVRADDKWLEIPRQPFLLLKKLASRAGEVVSREEILEDVFAPEYALSDSDPYNSLNVALYYVRGYLGRNALGHPKKGAIRSVYKVGYEAVKHLSN